MHHLGQVSGGSFDPEADTRDQLLTPAKSRANSKCSADQDQHGRGGSAALSVTGCQPDVPYLLQAARQSLGSRPRLGERVVKHLDQLRTLVRVGLAFVQLDQLLDLLADRYLCLALLVIPPLQNSCKARHGCCLCLTRHTPSLH